MVRRDHRGSDTPPAHDDRMFGSYELQELIGHGGFATVYRAAFHGEFGFRKQVALKVLRRRLHSLDERISAEFLNEARLGATIRHPGLVEFYECGRVGDRLYIAMELVEGPNLAQVMRMVPDLVAPLDDELILAIALQTARGLAGLHSAKLEGREINAIHRDMKPGNILLAPTGQAKITDYGITRFAADFYQTLDHKGPRGSPLYMSPEQARGEELSQASDVFSFGLIVLEMLLGTPVFASTTVEAIMRRVREADVGDALQAARERIPELADLLVPCMDANPDKRLPNGQALVRLLKGLDQPRYGEELIGQLAAHGFGILEAHRKERSQTPILKFWSHLTGSGSFSELDDESEQADRPTPEPMADLLAMARSTTSGAPSTPRGAGSLTGGTPGAAPADPWSDVALPLPPPLRPSRLPWLVAVASLALVSIVVLFMVVLPRMGVTGGRGLQAGDDPSSGDITTDATQVTPADGTVAQPVAGDGSAGNDHGIDGTDPATVTGGDGDAPTHGVQDDGDDAAVEPTTPPSNTSHDRDDPRGNRGGTTAGTDVADDADASVNDVTAPATEPPALEHEPISRAIRGSDVELSVGVVPASVYLVTLWYRAAPDGPWQTRKASGGEAGAVAMSIPAGPWLTQDAAEVDYFIEVTGPGGTSRVGSAVRPLRYTLR